MVVKQNFNSDDPFPASSDPEFVKAVIFLLYGTGERFQGIADSCLKRGENLTNGLKKKIKMEISEMW